MKKFSKAWKNSSKPRKQIKYRINAPLHIKQKFMHSHLSKELRKKYGKRSIGLRKGDKVKIMRGQFKKHDGKIERVDLRKTLAYVNGIEISKRDGSKKMLGLNPSNLVLVELNLDDRLRQKVLERKQNG